MNRRRLQRAYYVLEGVNSLATAYFCYYLFFFTQELYGFTKVQNLMLSALSGLVYMFGSWFGGKLAQRWGYLFSLRLGFGGMAVVLAIGSQLTAPYAFYGVMAAWSVCVCLTWPALEALVTENEPAAVVQHRVGLYNVVWAGTSALAYFAGGALLKHLGMRSLFWLPAILHGLQWLATFWLERKADDPTVRLPDAAAFRPDARPDARPDLSASPRTFLRLAWIANPFAYVAINTLTALMPHLADRLGLSLAMAGVCCSVWFFARLAAFWALWQWTGWHYRFRWLITAYLMVIVSFLLMLTVPHLSMLLLAQVVLGLAVGLIYYSSLYYSMDVGETKGEHGGFHEAAIGAGIFVGPAVGAASLHWFPQQPQSGTWAVAGLLVIGALTMLRVRFPRPARRPSTLARPG